MKKNPLNKNGSFLSYNSKKEAFFVHLDKNLEKDKCWLWLGCKDKNGYGRLTFLGKDERAHRFSWEIFYSQIPKGMLFCHKCDTPSCVNPEHLFIGNNKENMMDMIKKGRNKKVEGEKNPAAKLSENDVLEIRKWAKSKIKHSIIAYNFGITKEYISQLVNKRTWKDIQFKEKGNDLQTHGCESK